MDCTDCHCNLTKCIDDGQIDDCPTGEKRSKHYSICTIQTSSIYQRNQRNYCSLKLSQPGVCHNGPENGGEVAESHKRVVDGSGQVIIPLQEVLEVQHKHRCGQDRERKCKRFLILFNVITNGASNS